MAKINKFLLAKMKETSGLSTGRIYALIGEKVGATLLPRNLAALALASDFGINISKKIYATEDERTQLRSAGASRATQSGPVESGREVRSRTGGGPIAPPKRPGKPLKSNLVWVVHGRDLALRDAMYAFLRSVGLSPIEWNRAVKATKKGAPYIGEVLEAAFQQAAAVVVLLTPDDVAKLKKKYLNSRDPIYEKRLTGQARPNVLFEAGLAFGSHPDRTVLVELGDLRPFTDVAGRQVVRLSNDLPARLDFIAKLEAAGCAVQTKETGWIKAGDFGPTV